MINQRNTAGELSLVLWAGFFPSATLLELSFPSQSLPDQLFPRSFCSSSAVLMLMGLSGVFSSLAVLVRSFSTPITNGGRAGGVTFRVGRRDRREGWTSSFRLPTRKLFRGSEPAEGCEIRCVLGGAGR